MSGSEVLPKLIKITNFIVGGFLIVLGLYYYFSYNFDRFSTAMFQPFFIMLFGVIIILCELNTAWLLTYVKFMKHPLGRGLFDIYISALCLGGENAGEIAKTIGWISALAMLIIGLFYIAYFIFKGAPASGIEESLL